MNLPKYNKDDLVEILLDSKLVTAKVISSESVYRTYSRKVEHKYFVRLGYIVFNRWEWELQDFRMPCYISELNNL